MDLGPYVDNIHQQLAVAAEAGGDEARALAERLFMPLEAAIRLTLQELLTAAAEEITCELVPGSVEVRLRGREPELVVNRQPVDRSPDDATGDAREATGPAWKGTAGDEGGMSRINLRMPEQLKSQVERAAGRENLSVNTWLVRAATAALERADPDRPGQRRVPQGAQRYTGWSR